MNNPRRANGSRRTSLRKRIAAQGEPCHLCGKPIDYSLPAGHPMSFELDEIVPVSKGGDPFSRENVAPAHRICNQRRGNKDLLRSLDAPGDVDAAKDADWVAKTDLLSMPLPVSQDW